MVSLTRVVGGFPVTTMALAIGIWVVTDSPAMAQGGGGVGASTGGNSAYGGTVYGVAGMPAGPYGANYDGAGSLVPVYGATGIVGPGYPGFGLEYGPRDARRSIHRHIREASVHNWGAYVLGKECMYPYVADPYSDPKAALGFWPPYSAPAGSYPNLGPGY